MFGLTKPEVIKDEKKIEEVLTRGVEAVFPNKDFLKSRMMKGERLTFYSGIDPTGPSLHLGHLMPIKKLAQLQGLGHEVIFLIGDFTAMVGDPTDKMAMRKKLSHEEVMRNCKGYKKQALKFFPFPREVLLKYNSEWLEKMSFKDVLELASHITHAQAIKRDMFQERINQGKDLFLHEVMYPVMQGYDSVAMDVDGEIGGNDQTFNMLVGRDLMKKIKSKEKFVIATKLLIDSSGKKMGKTEGNMVALDDSPEEIFGKVMSWSDGLIIPGFELITDIVIPTADEVNANPKQFKTSLAKEVVKLIYDEESAKKAHESFEKIFSGNGIPENIQEIKAPHGSHIKDALVQSGIVSSNADWRRLIDGNAISVVGTDEVIKDPFIKAERDMTLRIGKKRFVKVVVK